MQPPTDENERVAGPLQPVDIDRWKSHVQGKTVREFIRYKISRQTAADRAIALQGMLQELPPETRGDLQEQLEKLQLLAHTRDFWQRDCAEFYDSVERDVRPIMTGRGITPDSEDLFNAFEFFCLALSRSVDTNRAIRGVARIAKITRTGWLVLAAIAAIVLYLIMR